MGDRATYVNQDITSHRMTISWTVLEIFAFDPILNQFSVQRSFYSEGLPSQVSTVEIAEQLFKKIYLSNPSTADDCAQYFSRIDRVATSSKIVNIVFFDMGRFTSCQYT